MKTKTELVEEISNDWNYKYRPKTLDDLCASKDIKTFLQKAINEQDFPNILMCSNTGMGKNSIVNVIRNNIDFAYLEINASSDTGIDVVRDTIINFAQTSSLKKKKCVILNEFCGTSMAMQQSLKEVMESYVNNCSFIITANNRQKLNEAIVGRCVELNMNNTPKIEIVKRLIYIFETENVMFEDDYITAIIKKYGNNIRKIINESYKLYKSYGDLKAEYIEDTIIAEVKDCFDFIFSNKDIKKINNKIKDTIFDDNVYTLLKEYCIDRFDNSCDMIPIICESDYRKRICSDSDLVFLSCVLQLKEII